MKNIDVKSLIIGALLTSTIFLGIAAAGDPKATVGKYQFHVDHVKSGVGTGDEYVWRMDTATGQVYKHFYSRGKLGSGHGYGPIKK
jgi:hypothetical protein